MTSVASSDVFALGLDTNGNFLYALQDGLTNFNATLGVSVNSSGLVAATGTYSGSIGFGATTLPIIGVASAFVATLQAPGPPPAAPSAPLLDSSSDTGLSSSDGITSATSPLLDINTAIAGDTVELIRNSVIVATRVGPGSIRDPGPLAQGTYSYTAIQIAPGGSASVPSAATSVTVLTTPPAAPAAPTLNPVDDSGIVGDGITNVRQPRLLVVAAANTTVQLIYGSGTLIGSAFATSAGTVTIPLSQPLADGTYAIQARLVDLAGNISASSPVFSLTILATPPPAPSTPMILPADLSGPPGGILTNVRQPRLTGTAKSGTTVEILTSSGTVLATTTATGGSYTARIATALSDGTYTVHAISIDAAANQSAVSANLTFTIDGTPPAAPTGLTLLSADDSGVKADNITNVRQPRLTGSAEVGSTVQVVDSTGKIYGSAITASNGVFTVTITSALNDGTYSLQARAIDLAANLGPAGTAYSLTILGTPPAAPSAPTIYAADDSGGPNLTNVNQPRLTGTATPNTTVQILGATGILYAMVGSGGSGSYLVQVQNPLADGTYLLHAVASDVAGNVSAAGPTLSLTILTATPATPSIPAVLAADDSGTVGDNITNVRQPRLTGTATSGLTIRLLNASGTVLGSGTAGSNGAFTIAPGSPLIDGTYPLHFLAVDAAGNVSHSGPTLNLVILGTPPPAPSPPTLLSADIAVGSSGSITPFADPTVVGVAVPGDLVSWINGLGTVVATAKASSSNGFYSLQAPFILTNRTYPVAVRQTDLAGNVSPLSGTFAMTVRVDPGDTFGNGFTDLSVVNPSSLSFSIQNPVTYTLFSKVVGTTGDVPVNGDFYGNGHDDIAVYRPSTSTFYVVDPVTGASESVQFGLRGDIPVPGDFDGDGRTDFAVFRPSNNTFYVIMSASGNVYSKTFAINGDIPVPADYYGNGHDDIAVYRPSTSTFYVVDPLTTAYEVVAVGIPNSTPIPADYEGLGHADFAVFEPGLCNFVVKLSATNTTYVKTFALPGDIPVPGDYFGDGHAELAVFRPSTATFYEFEIANSAYRFNPWGTPGQVKPVLAPITTWFSFGSTGTTGAFRLDGGSGVTSAPIPLMVEAASIDPATNSTPKKKGSTNGSLSLESWRP